jgi:hypothetical protein
MYKKPESPLGFVARHREMSMLCWPSPVRYMSSPLGQVFLYLSVLTSPLSPLIVPLFLYLPGRPGLFRPTAGQARAEI